MRFKGGKNMKSKLIKLGLVGLMTIAVALTIIGCDFNVDVKAQEDNNFTVISKFELGWKNGMEFIDEDTGVHYLVIYDAYHESGVSVTPLYDPDGTLKVD